MSDIAPLMSSEADRRFDLGEVSFATESSPARLTPKAGETRSNVPDLHSSEMMKWQTLRNVAPQLRETRLLIAVWKAFTWPAS